MNIWDHLLSIGDKLSAIVSAIFGAFFAIISYLKKKRSCSARERLDKVISPLFELIEPYMRDTEKPVPDEVKAKVDELIKNGTYLSGGRLREARAFFIRAKTQSSFQNLCRVVDHEYDKLCKSIDIPVRSIKYRKLYAPLLTFKDIVRNIADKILPVLAIVFISFAIFQIIVIASIPIPNAQSVEAFLGNDAFVIIIASIMAIIGAITLIRGLTKKNGD